MPQPQHMTQGKLDELTAELDQLRTVRKPAIAEQMNAARTRGGSDDNGEQDVANQDFAYVEGKIRSLESLINNAVIGDFEHADDSPPGVVAMWGRVTVERENGQQMQYQITGSLESDPAQGKISHVSQSARVCWANAPATLPKSRFPMARAS